MLIPAERLIDWTPGVNTGVIGGIPTDRTVFLNVTESPYFADNTGATDAQPAIQQAIDDCYLNGSVDGVYCPAGTYRLEASLTMGAAFDGKTIKGDGSTTIFMDYFGAPFLVGSASGTTDFGDTFADRTITAGLTKGSETITIAGSTTNFPVGRVMVIMAQSSTDINYPQIDVGGADVWTETAIVTQAVRIVSKGANTITFWPPLHEAYTGTCIVRFLTFQAEGIGMEDFKIDCTNTSTLRAIYAANCFGSWVKGVEVTQSNNYGIAFENMLNCEMRTCYIRDGKITGSNGAGVLWSGAHSCLMIDSISVETFPMWEINGGSGNVFAYNLTGEDAQTNTNHGPFNQYNLYEGNAIGFMISDGYFGGEGRQTQNRNYYYSATIPGVNLRRFSREFSLVGNIVGVGPLGLDGYPNIGNTNFDGTASLINADPWRDYQMTGELTTRTDDTHGEITLNSGDLYYTPAGAPHNFGIYWGSPPSNRAFGTVTSYNSGTKVAAVTITLGTLPVLSTDLNVFPGSYYDGDPAEGSYQEKDLDVEATTIDKGNHVVDLNTTSSTGGDTVETSYIFDSKPEWFASLPWPPYDYLNPGTASIENIPAGYRFVNGDNPPTATTAGMAGLAKMSGNFKLT